MLILSASPAFAQRGGFSPEGMFERFDQDGSGVLEPSEIENSPLRFMADRMGLDTSRGISREQMAESMDNMRRSLEERGGFGGPPGGFGGGFGDRGGDGDRGGFRDRGGDGESGFSRDRWGRDREDRRREDRSESRNRGTTTAKVEPPPRVTLDLPAAYVPGDTDRDGQIGLYEWTKWKSRAALGEFLGLDQDGDGFLTPRELSQSVLARPVDIASLYQSGPVVSDVASAALQPSEAAAASQDVTDSAPVAAPAPAPAGSMDPKSVIAAADQGQVKQAQRLFSVLDRNRDGTISEEEWSASRRLKPQFEKAGADLAEPMSSDLFVSFYVRIVAADGSI
ncbi:MAG: hypothetical protein AB7I48_06135 [Planctomycetaceae bacterium]